MIHIVFQQADVEIINKAIQLNKATHTKELKASLSGDVFEIKDEFAVGPIANIFEETGYLQRREWWKEVLQFTPYIKYTDVVNDKLIVKTLRKRLNADKDEIACLWVAQNAHDVCGYYWLISQLKDYTGRIYILHLHNLPFINEKGNLFYPYAVHEILPAQLVKAGKLARKITPSEFELDTEEWEKLCNVNALIRTLEAGKKIINQRPDYYDQYILSAITQEQQKLSKILSYLFCKIKVTTGDVFLVWRIRRLAKEEKLSVFGNWEKGWKDIAVSRFIEYSEQKAETVQF